MEEISYDLLRFSSEQTTLLFNIEHLLNNFLILQQIFLFVFVVLLVILIFLNFINK